MSNDPTQNPAGPSAGEVSKAASELNNLLQIISGASSMLGPDHQDSESYLAMLRESIARAERVASDLSEKAGGTSETNSSHPELAAFMRKKATAPSSSKPGILLVDDEQMTLTLMKRVLGDAGFEISTAESGFDCLDQFRRGPHRFSLILLDLTMPFMDGEETFARLKEIRPDIPVLLCTGFIQQERLDRLRTSGLAGFLRKPVPPEEIIAMVRSTLASVRYAGGINQHGMPVAM
jgi:CheY-like chemotaxis protein